MTTITTNALSLAAMEAELKPQVLETFDNASPNTRSCASCRDQHVEQRCRTKTSRQPAEAYKQLQATRSSRM
jgi:RNA polymerase primary sigma factor